MKTLIVDDNYIFAGTLAELFKDRTVAGIHAVDLVWGLGTIHCLTHEQPQSGLIDSL